MQLFLLEIAKLPISNLKFGSVSFEFGFYLRYKRLLENCSFSQEVKRVRSSASVTEAYPTGLDTDNANNLSLYIQRIDTTLKEDHQRNASIELSIMNSTGGTHASRNETKLSTGVTYDSVWIFSFIKFAITEDVFNHYLINGIRFDNGQDKGKSQEDSDAAILASSKMSLIEDIWAHS
ncbi:hypothetical protein TSAR_013220 [Trichomalopsis sarcophagae]|uniref:Uncharacterized protein n=1 Tax=Trichomalopsis sarcophagae TaxID=543379 RepID=A0A232FJ32_9HYME|nr:hypothetical protein TSAR_013220 [Trichomalopsis sarcophagae]